MKTQFFLCLGVLVTLVLVFSVQDTAYSQQHPPVETQVPQNVSGYPGGTETLTIIAPENAFILIGSPEDTFPFENASLLTQSGTIYRSTLTLPRQTGTYSLSVLIEETRYRVSVGVTTTPKQTGALTVRVDPFSGAPGTTATLTVSTTDSSNAPTDVTVILTATGGTLSSSTVTTGDDGTQTVTLTRGGTPGNENYVVASAANYALVSSRFFISEAPPKPPAPPTAGIPEALSVRSGNYQSGVLNTSLAKPLVVKVTDANDDPVEDVRVRFRVTQGSGQFSPRTVDTDADGLAETTFTPTTAERISVVATVAGVDDLATFTVLTAAQPDEVVKVSDSTTIGSPKILVAAANRPAMLWVDNGAIYALVQADIERFAPSVDNATNIAIGGGKVYWTEKTGESSGTINSADLDGSDVTQLKVIQSVPIGIAVDTENSKLYWTNSRGRIQRANLNGSGRVENVLQNLESPMDIALAGGNAYWTQGNGTLRFANLSSRVQIRDISTGADVPGSLAIANGKVYWTEMTAKSAGTINRANLDGSGATQLTSIKAVPMGIAVDRARSKLLWTNSRGRVQRANLDGSKVENIVDGLRRPGDMLLTNSIHLSTTTTRSSPPASPSKYDVNADGSVDNIDVSLVALALDTDNATYDVNKDGAVNVQDLLEVVDNRDAGAAAAPTVVGNLKLTALQIDRLQEQIDLLIATNDRSPAALWTLVYLQQLLATGTRPEKTQLLANYPNPFNPETWIPYELATDTSVKITIYNTQGVVIRTLTLGHQRNGYYTGRDRAAYWDGRNTQGEHVASGIYFYRLQTDTRSSLRKMVILK